MLQTVMDFAEYLSGTIGHVAHGKSTVVKAISGVQVVFLYLVYMILSFSCSFCMGIVYRAGMHFNS